MNAEEANDGKEAKETKDGDKAKEARDGDEASKAEEAKECDGSQKRPGMPFQTTAIPNRARPSPPEPSLETPLGLEANKEMLYCKHLLVFIHAGVV